MPVAEDVRVVEFSPSAGVAAKAAHAVEEKTPALGETPPGKAAELERAAARFASAARREQKTVARELAAKDKEAAIALREADLKAREEKIAGFRSAPLDGLKAAGLTYDDVTNAALNDGKPSAELIAQQAREEIKQLRAELAARDEKQKTEAKTASESAREEARKEFYGEAAEFVKSAGDAYELISMFQSSALVAQEIETQYAKGKSLSYKDAADIVEARFLATIEQGASSKKYQAKSTAPKPQSSTIAKPRATIADLNAATTTAPRQREESDPYRRAISRFESQHH